MHTETSPSVGTQVPRVVTCARVATCAGRTSCTSSCFLSDVGLVTGDSGIALCSQTVLELLRPPRKKNASAAFHEKRLPALLWGCGGREPCTGLLRRGMEVAQALLSNDSASGEEKRGDAGQKAV